MNILQTKELSLGYGTKQVIERLDLSITQGKITVLIGSNGCGKSTLLRSLARLLPPQRGHIILEGRVLQQYRTKEIAKRLAILPQTASIPEGITVLQLVKQGRYPYQTWLQQWSTEDETMVDWALQITKLEPFRDQTVDSLSGGQRQRAWIAMVLTQKTNILLLDEPTTYLDLAHQLDVLDILQGLNKRFGTTIVMVLHDLNLACRYADQLMAIHNQTVYAQGTPAEIMSSDMIKEVFALESMIIPDPLYGTPMCIPYSSNRTATATFENDG